MILPPAGYFEQVQAVLRRYDVLLIADEVITGFGRTGQMFGCETYGIKPDLITLAKALSAGYQPIGAVLIGEPMHQVLLAQSRQDRDLRPRLHLWRAPGLTAVALRALQFYQEDDILGQVRARAPQFGRRIADLASHPLVGDALSVGLVGRSS